jgi:hypothetical protein
MPVLSTSAPIYRIDKFVIPDGARSEFLARVEQTHALLRQQAGFVRDLVVEKDAGPAEFNFVTVVEWSGPADMEVAGSAVAALHKSLGFDRTAFIARTGIRADVGNYRALEI